MLTVMVTENDVQNKVGINKLYKNIDMQFKDYIFI